MNKTKVAGSKPGKSASDKTMSKPKSNSGISRIQQVTILILSAGIYINTLFFGYALDDGLFIKDNKLTQKGFSGIIEILTTDAFYGVYGDEVKTMLPGGRYRPLSQIMFAVEFQFFGFTPWIGHLLNILLYSILCLIMFRILKLVFSDFYSEKIFFTLPMVATLLFICHPLHTEVVANIKGRDEILSLLFSFMTLGFSIRFFQNPKIKYLVFSGIAFVLALLSKENSITFVLIIPLVLFYRSNKKLKDYLVVMIPVAVSLIFYFILRINALGIGTYSVQSNELLNNPFVNTGFFEKYATILLTWWKYLLLLIFPHPLTHDYYPKQIPIVGFSDFRVILALIIYAFLLIYGIIRIFKKDLIAFAILFFLLTFSISSNLVINIGTFMNERFLFAPLLGFCLLIAFVFKRFYNNPKLKLISIGLLLFILIFYSFKTISRNTAWKDSLTLFTTDVKTSVNSAKVNVGAAEVLIKSINPTTSEQQKSKILKQAKAYLNKGLEIYPEFKAGWIYLGFAHLQMNEYEESRVCFEQALKISNNDFDSKNYLYNSALNLYNEGNFVQAEKNFRTLIRYVPENTEYKYLLAEVYAGSSRQDSAIIMLKQLTLEKPEYDKAYNKLGEIYGRVLNNFDSSFYYLHKSYNINSKSLENLRNLGTAYGIQKKFTESLSFFLEAEKLKPDDKDILNKLVITYQNLGNIEKASEYQKKLSAIP